MPRNRRLLVKEGIYHIFNRGIARKDKNHYHLMVQPSEANLDKFMQFFGSHLSRGINQMIGGDGALFISKDTISGLF